MKEQQDKKIVPFYFWIHELVRRYVELIMDIIIVSLMVVIFVLISKTIFLIAQSLLEETNITFIISELMFIFILVETIRLLIIYLEFHRVAIDTMVEITIVSILREIILKGILHIEPLLLAGVGFIIIVLGMLLRWGKIRYEGPELVSIKESFFKKKPKESAFKKEEDKNVQR
ncbi:MAG: phosphate-starvation-inducible PsiE family protein [Thermodesulfovibrionales bacterium]|nr:phosphate-starvation-inducible PsiE family protein [Thermodesulfovibrionales bacterium]